MNTIVYTIGRSLYVNITNRCTNSCDFCIRKNGDGAYGSDSLWLDEEPSVEEIRNAILDAVPEDYDEIVFCGYGEPTCRLFDMLLVCQFLKKKIPGVRIRVNTNGQASLMQAYDVTPFFEGNVDVVSVSLNHPTKEGYDKICHSKYGLSAFDGILDFTREVKKYVPRVRMSVVRETLTDEELAACRRICDDLGVELKIRTYIGKE